MTEESTFQRKLRERREKEAAEAAARSKSAFVRSVEKDSGWDADLIPGAEEAKPRTATDTELDRLLGGVDIITAYHMWCGKMRVDRRRKVAEGIKVSCPIPGHRDANPSAWLNTDKNVWFCGRCDQGGDSYDIAAFHFGFEVPGYKVGSNFHELRKKMAQSFGYTFLTAPGLDEPVLVPPEKAKPGPKPGAKAAARADQEAEKEEDGETKAEVIEMTESDEIEGISLDWRKIVAEGTFLDTYMGIVTKDDAPEEYHFWNGLLGISMAAGRDAMLDDQKRVLANFFLCLLGPTGDGKSRSHAHLEDLLFQALPFKPEEWAGKGVELVESAASAEALISSFVNPVYDPIDPKKVAGYGPVRGLIKFDELSSLVGRASRKGNVLKPTLMEFYDGKRIIQTLSMTHGRKRAENPYACLFTTSQPKALKALLREEDASSGFLNRIVFATATPKRRIPIGGVNIDISPAIDPLKDIQGWLGFGRVITWEDSGVTRFTDFFHDVLHPAQQRDETGLLNRMDLLAKKLILLLCINEHRPTVNADTVDKVIGMFSYLTAAYGVPAAHIGSTINTEIRDELLKHINKHSPAGGITLRRLMQNLKRKNFPLEVVSKTLKTLAELGFIEVQTTPAGTVGRPTVKYKAADGS